ncbi:MAG: bifunctional DNA-formamidopyrimidine glycosylase/DNA-(apurinic or apyrimidinic site) lyase [Rhizobiaceae bacterium]|jgi:formamidopyrimidine-DNA glycosylase|nr:bifunctional DNA-formamidopyrimidine glycosylase/DNA-(apurinic or apyrimidinic site) lyase [Rhizobiaceae bacterium]
MPELPEVETVRRGLAPHVEGARIVSVTQRRADLRFPFPERFAERLAGRRIAALSRRAKYLLWHVDAPQGGEPDALISHLGMSGSFRVVPDSGDGITPGAFAHARGIAGPHDHLDMELQGEDGRRTHVIYNDPRRFGFMLMTPEAGLATHKLISGIGIEPLGNAFGPDTLARLFDGKAAPLKAALLDQSLVCGLGNIYVCEALWQAGLSPFAPAGRIGTQQGRGPHPAVRLAEAVRDVLNRAIEAGGSTLRDHRQTDGQLGYFQHSFHVYGREGEPCRRRARSGRMCRGVIARTVQSGRSTFHCPICQR